MKAIVVGAGIGGLTTALFLNKHGIDCEVFEQTPAIQELGVGINLMPQAIASFDEIGMLPVLEQSGIAPDHLFYRTGQGLTVWDEPRGRRAGLPYPQISIHRGRLQRLLYDAIEARGPGGVHVDRTFMSWHETDGQVEAHFVSASGERFAAKGDVLIGADGIHSQLRRILFPDEGMPRWSGRLMWRGTANWSKFGDGKHFVVAGSNDARLVLFPIAAGETDDTLLTNWVFGSDEVLLTQEFLAQMLGARRTTVTLLAQRMQAKGLIRYRRGHIVILDRKGLEACACECYQVMHDEKLPYALGVNL
jgi:5-methylphenazine-1-carboxylate 1-monooxygenase